MATFHIEVREQLARVIEIDAPNLDTALRAVEDQYHNSDIVLDSNDMVADTTFIEVEADGSYK